MMEGLAFQADKALLDTVFDGVAVIDLKTLRISLANKAAAGILGFDDPEEVIGTDPLNHIPREDRERISTVLASIVSGNCLQAGIEVRVFDKRGKEIWIMARGVKLASNGTSVLLASFRDITAQKLAEMALRQAEKTQLELLDLSNEMVIVTQDWKIAFVNRRFEELIGASRPSLIGLSILDLTHPGDRQAVTERYQKIINGEWPSQATVYRGVDKHGRTRWGEIREVPFSWEGQPAVITLINDITDQKLAEEAVRSDEERYRALLENANESILIVQDWKVAYINRKFEEKIGTPRLSLKGLHILDLTHPDDRQAVSERYQKIVNGERYSSGAPLRGMDKDGKTRWGDVREIPFIWEGKPAVMSMMVDITERKEAEEALRESEREYRQLVETLHEGLWVIDKHANTTFVNLRMAEMLGYPQDEMIGKPLLSFMDEPGVVLAKQNLDRRQRGVKERHDFEFLRKDGTRVYASMETSPILDLDGKYAGAIAGVQDVTERRKAEEGLQASEEKYRLLTEKTADIIWTTDLNLRSTYVSPSIQKVLGFTPEERLTHDLETQMTPASCVRVQALLKEELRREQEGRNDPERTIRVETEYYHKNSSTVWMENLVSAIRDEEGHIVGVHGVSRDVRDRRQAEEALRDSEVKYRHLFENTQTAMEVVSGETGLVVLANQATARIFGFASPDDLIGVDSMEYLLPEDRDRVVSQMAQALVDKNWNETAELRVRTKDGRLLWINGMVTHSEYQRKPALLVSLLDMTSRKEAELTVVESEEKNRLLIDNAAEGIAVVQDGVLKFVNPKVAELAGYPAQELISRSFTDLVHPDDRQIVADYYVKRLKGEEVPHTYQFRVVHKEGTTRWAEINAVLFKWEGRPAILAMLNDVTENKQAEDALRDSENRYRLIAENASDVIWTMDMDLRMTYTSPSIQKLTGYNAEEAISMKMEDGLTPASLETAAQTYSQGLTDLERNGGKPTSPVAVELEMECKDGSTVWAEVQVSFMQDFEGKVVGIMGVARNIDERRRARKALEESEERFRTLIEGARDAIAVIDLSGKVTYRSPSANRITGGVMENLLTTSLLERVHPDDAARATDLFSSLSKSPDGSVVDLELRYRRDDESWGVIEGRGTNLVHDPNIGGIVVNYRDITERRQAEEAFRESESRNRLLAENVSDVIWSLNMKSRQSFFSPSVTRLLGYTVEEATSLRIKEVVAPTSYARTMMSFSKISARQGNGSDGRHSSTQIEVELMRKDGSFVWVDISVTLVRDAEGQPAEVFGVIRDVTQRKKAEEALRTSEEYFRTLIENAWDAIAIVNAEGAMLYESPSSARIMGYEPEEIVGRNLIDFVRPEDVAANVDMFRRFRTEPGSTVMVDAGFRHKDGHYIECEGTLQNLLHDPKVNGIVANYRDVTDRRRAEEAILASEERFRNLVEATSDWVWETDPSGSYTYASSKACEVLGYEVSEIVGRSIFDFMPSRESSRFARTFKSHAEKREPFAFLETSRQRKDGKVIVMETSGVPFFGGDGRLLGYRGIGRDITNRKNVERELEKSVKKLEKTMEATIQAISYTMETRDPYTTGHQKRVTQLACAIAKEMGLAAWQIDGIRVAGLLHDIGKIAVPTEILSKPGKLSDIEFSMIKAHPKVGFDILKNVEFEWPIARVVVQHHERLDGSGYPYGIRGKDILQEARVLAVADVVEAMSSHRPYRAALGIEKALAEVARGEGTLYDPEVVRACAKVINERGFKFEI